MARNILILTAAIVMLPLSAAASLNFNSNESLDTPSVAREMLVASNKYSHARRSAPQDESAQEQTIPTPEPVIKESAPKPKAIAAPVIQKPMKKEIVPPPEPVFVSPPYSGVKSDLPDGWSGDELLPPGAIRLEELKSPYDSAFESKKKMKKKKIKHPEQIVPIDEQIIPLPTEEGTIKPKKAPKVKLEEAPLQVEEEKIEKPIEPPAIPSEVETKPAAESGDEEAPPKNAKPPKRWN